jgi:hypothetical protein
MPAATKKRPPLEMEPGEGKTHEKAESKSEELREGAEPDDKPKSTRETNRKRSAKGAKNTKAPMDGDCCCGGKQGASCDGNCGGYAKKMDALTPQEYLTACELGIQNRSRTYIRARLDAAERLDLKCGSGAISEGEKCTKGQAQKTGSRVRAGLENAAVIAGTAGTLYNYAQSIAKGMSGDLKGAGRALQSQGAFAALGAAGMAAKGERTHNKALKQQAKRSLGSGAVSAVVGSALTGDLNKVTMSGAKSAASSVATGLRNALGGASVAKSNVTHRTAKSRFERMYNRPGRRDSVYAAGFSPELDQLAI